MIAFARRWFGLWFAPALLAACGAWRLASGDPDGALEFVTDATLWFAASVGGYLLGARHARETLSPIVDKLLERNRRLIVAKALPMRPFVIDVPEPPDVVVVAETDCPKRPGLPARFPR